MPAFLFLFAACGGSEGVGYCYSDSSPIISGLEITPNVVVVGEGGGVTDVNLSFGFQQTDEWIYLIIFNVYDSAGRQVSSGDITTDLRGSGTHTFALSLNTTNVETYRITVHVTDRCFEESNLLDAEVQVVVTI